MMDRGQTFFSSLHIESVGGIAGDMLLGALIDLGADVDSIRRVLCNFHIPGLELCTERVLVEAESACYVRSLCPESPRCHRHLGEILAWLGRADLPPKALARAEAMFTLLAAAEAEVHGGTAETVGLHEVGELDSIMDIVGIVMALHTLGNPNVTAAPLPSGSGFVQTAHGMLACPVPAVRSIAAQYRVPLCDVDVDGETITPTGIAVLAHLCQRFESRPVHTAAARGVGAGTRRFERRPNVVRVYGWR